MLLIKNTKIYTMTDEILESGDILICDGKIKEVGINIDAKDADIIDGKGLYTLPGIIDAHSHIGVMDFSNENNLGDANEMTKPSVPNMEAIYGTDIKSSDFEKAYKSGITSVCITPGSGNVINGLAFATKTYGQNIFDMSIKNPIALKIALGGNPKRTYGKRDQMPMTRMAIAQVIKDYLKEAKKYYDKKMDFEHGNGEEPDYNPELEAAVKVFQKKIPLKIHCTQFDMITAIELVKPYDIKFSLEHAWGATDYIEEIVESGCDICFGPIGSMRNIGECRLIDIESVNELDKKGVNIALIADAPILSVDSIYHHAGEAVREGVEVERALKMITINPAKIMGIDDRVGTIEKGKDADIVLFKGLPAYDTNAEVKFTIINGEIVYTK